MTLTINTPKELSIVFVRFPETILKSNFVSLMTRETIGCLEISSSNVNHNKIPSG